MNTQITGGLKLFSGWKKGLLLMPFFAFVSCDRQDLNGLYQMAAENELMVERLEATVVDINNQIRNLHALTRVLMERLCITKREKTADGYLFTFSDSTRVELKHGITPVVEISPVTKNWTIDGTDSGVRAEGKDGKTPADPLLRIHPVTFCWEFSQDGLNWTATNIRAKGETGAPGDALQVGINNEGNWTIGGQETNPPLRATPTDGKNGELPMIGIDDTKTPPTWKISSDGGINWTSTNTSAAAEHGTDGTAGENAPYIESIIIVGDTITFTFNKNIPGSLPPARVQKVLLRDRLTISVNQNDPVWSVVNNKKWLLFGVGDTKVIQYTAVGEGIVSVDAVDVPDGIEVTTDLQNQEVRITSVSQSTHAMSAYGTFNLMVTNERGETAQCGVPVSFVFQFTGVDFTESYIYQIIAPSGQRVAYLYATSAGSAAKDTRYFYGGDFFYQTPASRPYICTLEPLVATDADGNRYKLCLFFEKRQLWFAENLKTTTYNDGTAIPNLTEPEAWKTDTRGAWRSYGDDKTYKDKYGLLYNGHAVMTGKLAPAGWHIPTDEEWLYMEWVRSGSPMNQIEKNGWRTVLLGSELKWNVGWNIGNGRGAYLFAALPGGICGADGVRFYGAGDTGAWWTATASVASGGLFYRLMAGTQPGIYRNNNLSTSTGLSVRCVKNL